MVFKERDLIQKIYACIKKIFVQPTSLLGELGEQQPIFPCSNLIFSEDAQKCTKILPFGPYLSQIQRFYHRKSTHPHASNEIFCWLQIRTTEVLNSLFLISDPQKTTVQCRQSRIRATLPVVCYTSMHKDPNRSGFSHQIIECFFQVFFIRLNLCKHSNFYELLLLW